MIQVDFNNQQSRLPVDGARLCDAARAVLVDAGVQRGTLSIAVVDDETIHQLNRQHLNHDYPTDVLSFVLEAACGYCDGEIIVSADTAERAGAEWGMSAEDELLLYLIHGALHLVGHDDHDPEQERLMRTREREYLSRFGVILPQGEVAP